MLYDPNWKPPTEIKLEPWQDILLKAADLIEKDGWCQHIPQDGTKHCAGGAIATVMQEHHDLAGLSQYFELMNLFARKAGIAEITLWNDRRGRTKEEVIAKLREVAVAG